MPQKIINALLYGTNREIDFSFSKVMENHMSLQGNLKVWLIGTKEGIEKQIQKKSKIG